MVGKYFRLVLERKVFLFLDIKGSTNLVEELGPAGTSIDIRCDIG